MFLTSSEYDVGVNTFSPEGRLIQVEYANAAIKLGTTALGICTNEGVVLVVEKRISSPLIEPNSIQKMMAIDTHVGCAMSGMTADANMMIDHGRVEATNHWFTYNEKMRVESVSQSMCDLALGFSEEDSVMARPFGVALLIAGIDDEGPQLFRTHPSGTLKKYKAKAIGAGSEGAQSALESSYHKSMSFVEAETKALEILRDVMEEKINADNVEVAAVKVIDNTFHIYPKEELIPIIARLPKSEIEK